MRWVLLLVLLPTSLFAQQIISGTIKDEDGNPIATAGIYNITSGKKAVSQTDGTFIIDAFPNDELRIIRVGYERAERKLSLESFTSRLSIFLVRSYHDIEEVEVSRVKLTGDLDKDSKLLAKSDKVAELQKQVGVPQAPEKPREKPSEVGRDILMPILGGSLNVQAIYDVMSGKAKKQKRLYAYEDLQDDIQWIQSKIEPDYFKKLGIPREKIGEFLRFSIGLKPEIRKYAKVKNVTKIALIIEETYPQYVKIESKD